MGDFKYVIALVLLLVVYMLFELSKPRPKDWSVTFSDQSTEPFGARALEELMTPLFDEQINHVYKSVYELYEEDGINANSLIIANAIGLVKEDTDLILEQVSSGRTFFLSALGYGGVIADTFGLKAEFQEFLGLLPAQEIERALGGEAVRTITYDIDGKAGKIEYPVLGATNSFEPFVSDSVEILAINDENKPVLVRYQNNGQLIMSTIPLAFTNYFALLEETTPFTEAQLLMIPQAEPLMRNQYYHLGRLESGTPLRVLLSNRSLRFASFVLLIAIIVFFLFQSKRQQRIIPVIMPLANLTLEFVRTLGRLYYHQSDHINLSHKRVLYWKEFVRTHYNLNTEHLNEVFVEELSRKSAKQKNLITVLVKYINAIEQNNNISDELLLNFEKNLNEFYGIE